MKRVVKPKDEVGIQSRFYKQHPVDTLMDLTLEEIDEKIDLYLDNYIKNYQKTHGPLKELPNWQIRLNDIRNKRYTKDGLGFTGSVKRNEEDSK